VPLPVFTPPVLAQTPSSADATVIESLLDGIRSVVSGAVQSLPGLIAAAIVLALTGYAAATVRSLCHRLGARTLSSRSLQLLFEQAGFIATWVVGILAAAVLAFPGLRLGDIIGALGLGTVAIGFAFQDIFKNFLAGILLLLQEPFAIGDQIVVSDYEGTVENIDIRTTRIRTFQGERVYIPNSTIFTSAVKVNTAYPARRTDLIVGVDYNTPLADAAELLQQLIAEVEGVVGDPAPEIDLIAFNNSSIDFAVRYWTAPQQAIVRRVQTRAVIAIKRAFDRADINIPYPIRTVYFYDQDKYDDYLPASPRP